MLSLLLASLTLAAPVAFEGEGHAYNPTISSAGDFIAFEVNRYSGDVDLYVATLTGADAADAYKVALPGSTMLGWGTGQALVNPVWHPQGVLLYEGAASDGRFRLYSHQPGMGSHSSEMVAKDEVDGDLTFPAVSSDGAVMSFVADATGHGDIRVRDTKLGTLSHVTKTPQSEMYPSFSADAKSILHTRKTGDGELGEDIYVIGIDGEHEALVSGGLGHQTRPVYAAGYVVFFDSSRGPEMWDVAAVPIGGGDKKVLAEDVRLPLRARPAVSPDGTWVAYSFDAPEKSSKVLISKVDGSKTVEIASELKACGEPLLASAGGKLILGYTALPSDSADWRLLFLEDVTSQLK
jgi:Tol biopolymer transport system component